MCMNKPKVSGKYMSIRISGSNINNYLKENFGTPTLQEYKQLNVKPFLQKDYGGDGDCTLAAILTVVKFYKPDLDTNEVYNYIEKIAKKYLYNPNWGTFPGFNKSITKEVFSYFGINKNVISKYFKNIGFNENTIIQQIQNNTPVIISITADGRKYYDNHTITIIGYSIYKNENDEKRIMFRVYDNWRMIVSFLDYAVLREDCMICY